MAVPLLFPYALLPLILSLFIMNFLMLSMVFRKYCTSAHVYVIANAELHLADARRLPYNEQRNHKNYTLQEASL